MAKNNRKISNFKLNEEIYKDFCKLSVEMQKRRLKFYGHLLRMETHKINETDILNIEKHENKIWMA